MSGKTPLSWLIFFEHISSVRSVRALSLRLCLSLQVLIDLVPLDLVPVFENHVQQFVYVPIVQPHVHLFGTVLVLYDQDFRQCSEVGIEKEEEFIAVDLSWVLKAEDIDYCLEVGLIGPF